MKIKVFEMDSQIGNDVMIKVFVNDNDTRNPPHCHSRYDNGEEILGEFMVSLVDAKIL